MIRGGSHEGAEVIQLNPAEPAFDLHRFGPAFGLNLRSFSSPVALCNSLAVRAPSDPCFSRTL
jgi:hypothetical protein